MRACNRIAMRCWPRSSVGREVEQIAEDNGWQESEHVTCCSTDLPACTREKHLGGLCVWRYHGEDHHRPMQSSIDPQQGWSVIGAAAGVQQESREPAVSAVSAVCMPPFFRGLLLPGFLELGGMVSGPDVHVQCPASDRW
jgi:hypothetical protein